LCTFPFLLAYRGVRKYFCFILPIHIKKKGEKRKIKGGKQGGGRSPDSLAASFFHLQSWPHNGKEEGEKKKGVEGEKERNMGIKLFSLKEKKKGTVGGEGEERRGRPLQEHLALSLVLGHIGGGKSQGETRKRKKRGA